MPLHLLVKWGRWFLQIIDIHVGNFNIKLTGRWFPQIVDRDSGNLYPIYIYITKIVVLVSEPVRGRSRATELPCYIFNRYGYGIGCCVFCQKKLHFWNQGFFNHYSPKSKVALVPFFQWFLCRPF